MEGRQQFLTLLALGLEFQCIGVKDTWVNVKCKMYIHVFVFVNRKWLCYTAKYGFWFRLHDGGVFLFTFLNLMHTTVVFKSYVFKNSRTILEILWTMTLSNPSFRTTCGNVRGVLFLFSRFGSDFGGVARRAITLYVRIRTLTKRTSTNDGPGDSLKRLNRRPVYDTASVRYYAGRHARDLSADSDTRTPRVSLFARPSRRWQISRRPPESGRPKFMAAYVYNIICVCIHKHTHTHT